MQYRIMMARNGRYYVQEYRRYHNTGLMYWTRCSPFYHNRRQCRDFVDYQRGLDRRGINRFPPRVVEYL